MVFFTNAENSVTGLTQKQIQDIYVYGKYTNWNQIGGPDAELLPYRRNTDSGSHALMEQYFLEGGKLSLSPDVHNVLTSYAMSSALTDVAGAMTTDPLAYAMGYSVYYYYVNSYWLLGDAGEGSSSCWRWMGCSPRMRPSPTEATPWRGTTTSGAPGRRAGGRPPPGGWRSSW